MLLQELDEDCLLKIYCYAPQLRECLPCLRKYPDIRKLGYEYGDNHKINYCGFEIIVGKKLIDEYWELVNSDEAKRLSLSSEKMKELEETIKKICNDDSLLKELLKDDAFKINYDAHMS